MANSVRFFWMSGAVVALAMLSAPGCSDDEEGGSGGTGGSTGGTSGSGTGGKSGSGTGGKSGSGGSGGSAGAATGGSAGAPGTGGSAGAPGTGGSAGAPGTGGSAGAPGTGGSAGGGAENPSCEDFCTENRQVCTGLVNEQYATQADCTTACATWEAGVPDTTTGDTLACRVYHTEAASANAGQAALHCPHTGEDPTAFCVP
jgi:hypothetical protein